jgi:hypothetical protein
MQLERIAGNLVLENLDRELPEENREQRVDVILAGQRVGYVTVPAESFAEVNFVTVVANGPQALALGVRLIHDGNIRLVSSELARLPAS